MDAFSLKDQRVLIREDFNVPMLDGNIAHTARIDAALPTIKKAIDSGAKVILMSHLGRPKEGHFDPIFSLQPIADYLTLCLKQKVSLVSFEEKFSLNVGDVVLLENVRFLIGEEENSPALSKKLAALCDIFIMDAFAVAHRAQASTCGVVEFASRACAGPLLLKELEAISKVMQNPQSPVVAIVGGSKVSTKLALLKNVLDKVDTLVVGGGIANTFLAAKGYPVGDSLYEPDLVPTAKVLLEKAQKLNKVMMVPQDVVVSTEGGVMIKLSQEVKMGEKILDIGPESQKRLHETLLKAKTILWNGPVGIFENPDFAQGTMSLANSIAASKAFSVAGGGDTLAAIEQFNVADKISYLSTGGGAFLEVLEGKVLPTVKALEKKDQS